MGIKSSRRGQFPTYGDPQLELQLEDVLTFIAQLYFKQDQLQ